MRARGTSLVSFAALAALVTLGAACGRLGYDALASTSGSDAAPPADAAGSDGGFPTDAATDAPPAPDAAPALDYCNVLPPLAGVPVIDGVLEPGLALRTLDPMAWDGPGSSPPAGQTARYAVAWREGGLYVYVEVTDPSRVPAPSNQFRWCGDSVEIYVDDNGLWLNPRVYDDPGTRQLIVAAPADSNTQVHGGEAWCSTCGDISPRQLTGAAFLAVPREGGYVVEAFVVADDLARSSWSLAAGGMIGLDLAVNVSEPAQTSADCIFDGTAGGSRLGAYYLRADLAATEFPYDNNLAFCTPSLLAP